MQTSQFNSLALEKRLSTALYIAESLRFAESELAYQLLFAELIRLLGGQP